MRTIRLKTTKTGQLRATYWGMRAFRWLPMPLAEAELMLATGQAERDTTTGPLPFMSA